MYKIKKFIIGEFSNNFIMLFLPFLSILSIIYVIRIASFSQKIDVDAKEMFELFVLFLPDILFYTLPISFIVALGATLLKLSNDNELIALFSYGLAPSKLIKIFIPSATLFSMLLLLLSLLMIPKSTYDFKQLKAQKIANAKLSVEANKLGQKFGKYIFFAEKKDGSNLENMVLFTQTSKKQKIILIADKGKINNSNGALRIDLISGTGNTFMPNSIESLQYSKLSIFHYLSSRKSGAKEQKWNNIITNKQDMSSFAYNVFISISPLLTLLLVVGLSVINPRYQKSSIYTISGIILVIIYTFGSFLKSNGTLTTLILSILSLLIIGYTLFKKRVRNTF